MSSQPFNESLDAHISHLVEKRGWACVNIQGMAGGLPNLSYSVGMTETLSHPEIVMAGFELNLMQQLINNVGALVEGGARMENWGSTMKILQNFPVFFRLIQPDAASKIAMASQNRYGRGRFELLQMFLPDPAGNFPWDQACDQAYAQAQNLAVPFAVPTAN